MNHLHHIPTHITFVYLIYLRSHNFNLIYITGSGFSSNASLDFVKSRYATLSCINGNKLYVQQNGKDQITAGFYRSTYNASDPGNLSLTLIYDFSYLLGADQEPLFVRSSKTLNDRIFIGFNDGNNYNISVVMYNPYSLQLDKKFNKIKVSGDQKNDTSNSECCINSKNEFARRLLDAKERDNK